MVFLSYKKYPSKSTTYEKLLYFNLIRQFFDFIIKCENFDDFNTKLIF